MKILVIGDFHGKFPQKLRKRLKKEKFDIVLSVGDFADTSILRNLEFKHWKKFGEGKSFEEIIGKKKYKELLKKTHKTMRKPLGILKCFKKPIIVIYGNSDPLNEDVKKYRLKGIEGMCKSLGIKLLKTNTFSFKGLTIAGFSGYRGAMSKGLAKATKKQKIEVKKLNSKWDKRLKRIFKRLKNPEKTIFLTHDVPRGYFDKVIYKKSPLYGKYIGDEYFTKYLKKYKPAVFVCGHMHEYQGMKKLSKTKIITTGPAFGNRAGIIEMGGRKIKVKFIK